MRFCKWEAAVDVGNARTRQSVRLPWKLHITKTFLNLKEIRYHVTHPSCSSIARQFQCFISVPHMALEISVHILISRLLQSFAQCCSVCTSFSIPVSDGHLNINYLSVCNCSTVIRGVLLALERSDTATPHHEMYLAYKFAQKYDCTTKLFRTEVEVILNRFRPKECKELEHNAAQPCRYNFWVS